jgi:hypothetical protein
LSLFCCDNSADIWPLPAGNDERVNYFFFFFGVNKSSSGIGYGVNIFHTKVPWLRGFGVPLDGRGGSRRERKAVPLLYTGTGCYEHLSLNHTHNLHRSAQRSDQHAMTSLQLHLVSGGVAVLDL